KTDSKGEPDNRFVSRNEMLVFLSENRKPENDAEEISRRIRLSEENIQKRLENSSPAGISFPLEDVRSFFALDNDGVDLITALLAPELDYSFARAYTHAMCDFTKKFIDTAFLKELLFPPEEGSEKIFALLSDDSILVKYRLIRLWQQPGGIEDAPFFSKRVALERRVVNFLAGTAFSDERWNGVIVPRGQAGDARLVGTREQIEKIQRIIRGGKGERIVKISLKGPEGCGKKASVMNIFKDQGKDVVFVNAREFLSRDRDFKCLIAEAFRESRLRDCPVYFDGFNEVLQSPPQGACEVVMRDFLQAHCGVVFIGAAAEITELSGKFNDFIPVAFPFPSGEIQEQIWNIYLPARIAHMKDVEIPELVKRYSLSGEAIRGASAYIENLAKGSGAGVVTNDDLYRAIRNQLHHRLGELAEPVSSAYTWEDIILKNETRQKLREMLSYFRHKEKILREWGFGGKLIYGKGLSALFSGPPGTGKTMAASIIAKELGMEVFRIDLSRIVDKYIGETEKNLARIFDEAVRGQAVLLFDEADSLFAKRTEVRTSVDRYANIEVNYLLQKMENYDGITILTTNFESSIDEAFKRRIKLRINFPFPDAAERERMWRSFIPKEAPVESSIPCETLAA
ncbi:MAG: ATP-binding protein, partial [Deltaproteobacteria bacterium]|nr:ATP-binding protein [Deltaproteobacteria bacterium]